MGSRRLRLLRWFLALGVVTAGIMVLVLVAGGSSSPPAGSELTPGGRLVEAKPRHLTAADRRAINATLDSFVNHAVKRRDVGASYAAVTPALRAGMSRAEWSRGDIPIYPYKAAGTRFHEWTLEYAESDEVGVQLILRPDRGSRLGPIVFHVYLKPERGRWLVDSFLPAATLAPVGEAPKVTAVADFNPGPQAEPETGRRGQGQVSQAFVLVPFAIMGALLLGLVAWGIARRVRDRRLAGPRTKGLPPLPPRVSRRVSSRGRRSGRAALPSR